MQAPVDPVEQLVHTPRSHRVAMSLLGRNAAPDPAGSLFALQVGAMATPIQSLPQHPHTNGRMNRAPLMSDGSRLPARFLQIILAAALLLAAAVLFLASRTTLDVTARGPATLRPASRIDVRSTQSGLVRSVGVVAGESVRKGDLLVELDSAEWLNQRRLLEAEVELNASRKLERIAAFEEDRRRLADDYRRIDVERRQAALQLLRTRTEYESYFARDGRSADAAGALLPVRLASLRVDQSQTALDAISSRLLDRRSLGRQLATFDRLERKLGLELDQVDRRLSKCRILSPAAGLVATREPERLVGTYVREGEAVLQLVGQGAWKADVLVGESDIARVRVGQRVRLLLNAFPHLRYSDFEGTVTGVPALPVDASAGSPLYAVRVDVEELRVEEGPDVLLPSAGMAGEARIILERGNLLRIAWSKLLRSLGKVVPADVHP